MGEEQDEQEKLLRLYYLRRISRDDKYDIAARAGYIGKKDIDSLNDFLCELDRDQFLGLIQDYKDATRTTNFLFSLHSSVEDLVSFFKTNQNWANPLMKKRPVRPRRGEKKYFIDSLSFFESQEEMRFNFREIGFKEIIQEYDFKEHREVYHQVNKIKTIPVRMYLQNGLMIIRCSDRSLARNLSNKLEELDPIFKSNFVGFDDNSKMNLINWLLIRGTSIHFGEEETGREMMHLSMGVDKANDRLRDVKTSEKFLQAIEDGVINYISASALRDRSKDDNTNISPKDRILTFVVNFEESKIHFRNNMYENEIKTWILIILNKCGFDFNITKSELEDYQGDLDEFA